jgi:hypothetical protein
MIPKEKYLNDVGYNSLVNMLVSIIDEEQFTPSEMMDALLLAYKLRFNGDDCIDLKETDQKSQDDLVHSMFMIDRINRDNAAALKRLAEHPELLSFNEK